VGKIAHDIATRGISRPAILPTLRAAIIRHATEDACANATSG
jgi:hypothetical protein